MVPTTDLEPGQLRLLEVDNRVIVPVDTHIRVITTGGDVIHSWAVPSLGVKMDSIPGRLNQTSMLIQREGVYYGQCSELCGIWHGFMPIVVECVSLEKYLAWITEQLNNSPPSSMGAPLGGSVRVLFYGCAEMVYRVRLGRIQLCWCEFKSRRPYRP